MSDLETYSHKLLTSDFARPGQAWNPKEVGEMRSRVVPSLTGLQAGAGALSVTPSPLTSSPHPPAQRGSHSHAFLAASFQPKDPHLRLQAQHPCQHPIIPHRGEPPSASLGSRKLSLHCLKIPCRHGALTFQLGIHVGRVLRAHI